MVKKVSKPMFVMGGGVYYTLKRIIYLIRPKILYAHQYKKPCKSRLFLFFLGV